MKGTSQKTNNDQSSHKGRSRPSVNTLEKGLDVLFLLARKGTPLTVSEIANILNRPTSSLYRIVAVLRKYGLLEKIDGEGHHILGKRNFMLASGRDEQSILIRAAQPELRHLVDETEETALLAVLLGDQVICIDAIESSKPFRLATMKGHEMPLHRGATGKILLAFLPAHVRRRLLRKMKPERFTSSTISDQTKLEEELRKIKKRGYAFSLSEVYEGAMAIAVPIFADGKKLVGSLSLAGLEQRMKRKNKAQLIKMVVESAKRVSRSMGQANQESGDR